MRMGHYGERAGPHPDAGRPNSPNGQAHNPSGAGPQGVGSLLARGWEQAQMRCWACGTAGTLHGLGGLVTHIFIYGGNAFDLLKSMWGTGQSGETDVK